MEENIEAWTHRTTPCLECLLTSGSGLGDGTAGLGRGRGLGRGLGLGLFGAGLGEGELSGLCRTRTTTGFDIADVAYAALVATVLTSTAYVPPFFTEHLTVACAVTSGLKRLGLHTISVVS